MTAVPITQPSGRRRARLDIPRIRLLSWLGLESIAWGVILAHLIKWAVSFGYYAWWQVKYGVGPAGGSSYFTVWTGKDFWDRLVVHFQNGLPGIVAVAAGLVVALIAVLLLARWHPARTLTRVLKVVLILAVATGAALATARGLAGWHVHWFPDQQAPQWWVTMRHDIRDVGISLVATVIALLLFAKPKYPADDNPGAKVYVRSFALGLSAALVPIALVALLAWKVPWLLQHGYKVPANWGVWASEANGWIAAGTWITVAMGVLGGIVAKLFIQRPADDIQWFIGERSAGHIRSETGLDALRGNRVIGSPSHRRRVHWLLDHDLTLPDRNPWLVRALLVVGFLTLVAAGAGAWLNLVGPAAPH